jgi:hypothetical protein
VAVVATAAGTVPQSGDQPAQHRVMHEATRSLVGMKFPGSIGFPHAAPERTHAEGHVRSGEIVVDPAELRGRRAEAKEARRDKALAPVT